MTYILLASVVVAVAYSGWKLTARGAYESAEYTVVESDGPFEIREYPTLMMATTNMRFKRQGEDGSFMRLFRYISGANENKQKVAMTTPVFMEPEDVGDQGQMGFVIPKETAERQIPNPVDDDVRIKERPAGRYAVIRFAGRIGGESFGKAEGRLLAWMSSKGLARADEAEFAGYDPPWTPGPLRRNEVLIRVN